MRRFKEDALPPWTAISTSIGIFVIAFLVGHMLHASRNRIDKVEENCRIFQELKMRADDAVIAKSQVIKPSGSTSYLFQLCPVELE